MKTINFNKTYSFFQSWSMGTNKDISYNNIRVEIRNENKRISKKEITFIDENVSETYDSFKYNMYKNKGVIFKKGDSICVVSPRPIKIEGWEACESQYLKSAFLYDVVGHHKLHRMPVYQLLAEWLKGTGNILYCYMPNYFKGFDESGRPIFGDSNFQMIFTDNERPSRVLHYDDGADGDEIEEDDEIEDLDKEIKLDYL